jgi:hypothetical protein
MIWQNNVAQTNLLIGAGGHGLQIFVFCCQCPYKWPELGRIQFWDLTTATLAKPSLGAHAPMKIHLVIIVLVCSSIADGQGYARAMTAQTSTKRVETFAATAPEPSETPMMIVQSPHAPTVPCDPEVILPEPPLAPTSPVHAPRPPTAPCNPKRFVRRAGQHVCEA